jgi:hypothetical protein
MMRFREYLINGTMYCTVKQAEAVLDGRDARIAKLEHQKADMHTEIDRLLGKIREVERDVERLRGTGTVDRAIEEITRYGSIDGDHHRSWLLQEVLAILSGWDNDRLKKELKAMEWEPGIPP